MASTDVAVIGGGMGLLHAVEDLAKEGAKVTACLGNPFIEFAMASCVFLTDPRKHLAWVSEPDKFKVPGVEYVFDAVTEIDPVAKVIKFAKSPPLSYKAVIVATGMRLPLIAPVVGNTLAERSAEVSAAGKAIAGAKTVVLNGSGTVGVEMAGDIKARHPNVEVILLARSGTILNGDPLPAEALKAVKDRLAAINVKVVKGSAPPDAEWMDYKLSGGTLPLTGGDVAELKYDVYMPTFGQRPNTQFLDNTKALNERKQIIANESLQSTVYPEIFGVNTTDQKLVGHPVSSRVTAQTKTCVKNVLLFLKGANPERHVDKEQPAPLKVPMNIKVGHGPNGWMYWNQSAIPAPVALCCCMPCGGGFPFCPLPCCWCAPGCSTMCGNCGGIPGSSGAAELMEATLLPIFAGNHAFTGVTGKPGPMTPPTAQQAFK